jgi:prepilin-type N-terminal cleavage/methylation domain-containing protein
MKTRQAGFSLIELLVVVALILILATISVPSIAQYWRNYQIRGAAEQVAAEIQTARTKAIMRNVNRAALLVVLNTTTYRWVTQDQTFVVPVGFRNLGLLLADNTQTGPIKTLPQGVQFLGTGATTSSVGFNRLGAQCDVTTTACGSPLTNLTGGPATPYVNFAAATGQATVTLTQNLTGLQRTVTVTAGGRVLAQP